MNPIELFTAFMEGTLSLSELQQTLVTDESAEAFLHDTPAIAPYSDVSFSNFDALIAFDPRRNGDCLNAQDLLCQLLDNLGAPFRKTARYEDIESLQYKAQPRWLDMDSVIFGELMIQAGERQGHDLLSWLKSEIRTRYRYEKKPPLWLQSPNWPHESGQPLTFIKQTENPIKHDRAYDYHFRNESTGEVTIITQTL